MDSLVLSPQSAEKFFMISAEDLAKAKGRISSSGIYAKLETEINFVAGNRDLLTDEERKSLPPIIDLSGLNSGLFRKTNLGYCILDNSVFSASLIGARFTSSRLRNASFADSYLRSVSFNAADLTGADFKSAEISYVDFTGADLTRADFRDCIIDRGCNFRGAKNVDKAIGLPAHILAAVRQAAFGPRGEEQPAAPAAEPA